MNQKTTAVDINEMDKSPLGGIDVDIPDARPHVADSFLATYGVRTDDNAMVFHFFAPVDESWDPEFDIAARLNAVTPDYYPLDRHRVRGGYTEEMDSYFVIVPSGGASIVNPYDVAERYLSAISAYAP